MDRAYEEQRGFREGDEVFGADGEKVGSVVAVQPGYVVVEKGFFFPTDYSIPMSAIASNDDGRVYLSVGKDEALNQGWDAAPMGTVDYAMAETYGTAEAGIGAGVDNRVGERPFEHDAVPDAVDHLHGDERIRVPVHEEELTATTRQREIGEVEIEKDVVQEQRTLEVPVTEERVRVDRRAVDRPLDAADATAFREGVIEVPIMGEEVELQKQVRVAEEVEVGKEAVQRTEQVAGSVRREEVRVREVADDATPVGGRNA